MEQQIIGIIGVVLVFGTIVFIHELGHFFVAKLSGMTVHEFALGFGPLLFSRVKNGTRYSIRALPLGGYVRIAGMEPGEEDDPNGFNSKSFFPKFATILAGATMNIILALVLLIVLGMAIGDKVSSKAGIASVAPGSPAARAGLQANDKILKIAGVTDPDPGKTSELIRQTKPPVEIVVSRQGKTLPPFRITPEYSPKEQRKLIGIGITEVDVVYKPLGVGESVKSGLSNISQMTVGTLVGLGKLVTGRAPVSDVSGPVGIIRATHEVAKGAFLSKANMGFFLLFFALISLSIGIFNLLPLPALDGSHLAIIVIEKLRGKPFNAEKKAILNMVGLALLLLLVLVITGKDILAWYHGQPALGIGK